MRRLFSLLLAALCGVTALPAGARDFSSYLAASKAVLAKRELPRLKDPMGAVLLDIVGDSAQFLDGTPFTQDEMMPLMEVCTTANQLNVTYMLHGLQQVMANVDKSDEQAVKAALQGMAARNVVEYQDELAILLPFTHRCQARMAPLMVKFLADLPPEELTDVRKAGARQVQNGAYSSYAAYLIAISGTGIREANMRRLSSAMAEVAPAYASILTLPLRRQLRDQVVAAKAKAQGEFADDLSKVIQAMESDSCNAMCSLQ